MEQFTVIGDQIYNLFMSIPSEYIGLALGSSLIVGVIGLSKKIIKVANDIKKSRWFGILTLVVTGLAAFLDFVVANGQGIAAYGKTYAALLAGVTFFYHGIVRPIKFAIAWFNDRKDPIAEKIEEIENIATDSDLSTANVNATPTPETAPETKIGAF